MFCNNYNIINLILINRDFIFDFSFFISLGIKRRPVEMQERDFIREQGLASEAMCDLGLTAVNSSDILDILYTDFQNKYEEYCKHQRDRQVIMINFRNTDIS